MLLCRIGTKIELNKYQEKKKGRICKDKTKQNKKRTKKFAKSLGKK